MRILKRIQKTWTKGDSLEIALTNAADVDTDSDSELQPVGSKETSNVHRVLESVKIEQNDGGVLEDGVDETGALPGRCQSAEHIQDKTLLIIKQARKENKRMNNQDLDSGDSRLRRFKTKSKTKQITKTKVTKSSTRANVPRGRKNQPVPEALSIVSAEERATDDETDSTEIDFICTECGLNLRTFAQLKNHREQEHATDDAAEFNFICTDCGLNLETFVQLKNHREQEHAVRWAQQMLANSPKDAIGFDGNRLGDLHIPTKRKKQDNDCELVCPVCNKKFSMKCELRQHQTIHSGERPYMCSVCGKTFRVRSILTGHMKIHFGDKRHSCSQCGKSFVQSSSLKDHMAVHSKIRTHICNVCGKDFFRRTRLNYHMRSHTGEKPYSCSVCEERFALSRQLTNHLRMHSDEWPYSCDVCSKKFKVKNRLNQHKKLHQEMEPFSSGSCPKDFTQAGNLRVHMRTHIGKTKTHLDLSQGLGCWGINVVSTDFA